MSWHIASKGFAAAVGEQLQRYIGSATPCPEPEQQIRANVFEAAKLALDAFPADEAVEVELSGSQSSHDGKVSNQVSVNIEPIHGFVK